MQPVIVKKNVQGHGHDTANAATFCTRHEFQEYSDCVDNSDRLIDGYMKAIRAIPGVTRIATYEHDSLYDLHVKKTTAYDWAEIEPAVMLVLQERHEHLTYVERKKSEAILAAKPDPAQLDQVIDALFSDAAWADGAAGKVKG